MTTYDLRDWITIQSKTTVVDTQLGRSTTWGTVARVQASITQPRMSERLQAAAIRAEIVYQVVIRYRADVTALMRLLWTPYRSATAKTLQIHGAADPDGRRQWLSLDCGESI